jgi:6-pyruvoyltetrahydropterin/6-carboxytetrahydropterin synthase
MDSDRPVVRLVRSYRFSSAHFYWDPRLGLEENEKLFGKCANRHGHGHDYRLDVVLRGVPDPATGMLLDLRELDRTVTGAVLDRLDHRNLNHEVEFFARRQPTCENLAVYAWQSLAGQLPAGLLEAVRIHETGELVAEYRGPGG